MDTNKIPICNELVGTEYEKIINMTNEEAADVIANIILPLYNTRGNGKSTTQLYITKALLMAIYTLRTPRTVADILDNLNTAAEALGLPPIKNEEDKQND